MSNQTSSQEEDGYDPMVHIVDLQSIQPVLDVRGRLLSCNTPPDTICPMAGNWPRGWMQFVTLRKNGNKRDCLYCPPLIHTRKKFHSLIEIIDFAVAINLKSTKDVLRYHAFWLFFGHPNTNSTLFWDVLLAQGDLLESADTLEMVKKAGLWERYKMPYPKVQAKHGKQGSRKSSNLMWMHQRGGSKSK